MRVLIPLPLQMGLIALVMVVALAASMLGGNFYIRHVEAPRCYKYASQKRLSNLQYLEFTKVVPAGRHHVHECGFTDRRTGAPVSLKFDRADTPSNVPYALSRVIPFLAIGIMGGALAGVGRRRGEGRVTALFAPDRKPEGS